MRVPRLMLKRKPRLTQTVKFVRSDDVGDSLFANEQKGSRPCRSRRFWMVGPPSDERNCRTCDETSDAVAMLGKAESLLRDHLVSFSFSAKVCVAFTGLMAVRLGSCGHHGDETTVSDFTSRSWKVATPHSDSSSQTAVLSP